MLVLISSKYSKENDSYKKQYHVMIRDLSSQIFLLKIMCFMCLGVCVSAPQVDLVPAEPSKGTGSMEMELQMDEPSLQVPDFLTMKRKSK